MVPGGASSGGLAIALVALIGFGLWTAHYTVPSDSVAVVQYRISEPTKYLFEVREPSETLRYVSESVMREVVGDRTVDEVITIGRQEIESEAYRQVEEIRGVADAKATEIYASAYNQSPASVDFYEFTRTMQAYKTMIVDNTTLILSTDSDLFKFLKGMSPKQGIGSAQGVATGL